VEAQQKGWDMEYKGKLKDFQGGDYQLVQNDDEVEHLNKEYKTEFNNFLLEFYNGDYAVNLYGVDGIGYDLNDNVYLVTPI
jgi:hypothetical protein